MTAVVSDDPALEQTLVGAYSRFVLVGADGIRLHEEVLYAGGWLRDDGSFRRVESLSAVSGLLDRGLSGGVAAAPHLLERLAALWPRGRSGLLTALDRRTSERLESLKSKLASRQEDERRRIITASQRFSETLRRALGEASAEEDALFSMVEGRGDPEELKQYQRDRAQWEKKLTTLEGERDRELARVASRYSSITPHSFPVAVIFVVPGREASR